MTALTMLGHLGLFLWITLIITPGVLSNCPDGCECKDTKVACKIPAARAVPRLRIPDNTTVLDLSGNNILNVPPDSFKHLPNLEELILDDNKIYFLQDGAFSNCPNLRKISLETNNLHMIEDEVFSVVSNLEELYLASNSLSQLPHLHHNVNLTTLCTYGNKIKEIPHDAFTNNTKLMELKMKNNQLRELPRSAFPANVSTFIKLDLVGNQLSNVPPVIKEMTMLQDLKLCYNPIKIIPVDDFRPLDKLQNLSLAGIGLNLIPTNLVLPHLKRLSLKKNNIDMDSLDNLRLPELEYLNLHKTNLRTIPAGFAGVPALTELDLSSCGLVIAAVRVFAPLVKLKTLNLEDNRLTGEPVEPLFTQANSALEVLKLNSNNIQNIRSTYFQYLFNLKTLDLSNNSISSLPESILPISLDLTWLDLSHNSLTRVPEVLKRVTANLKTLNVSSNKISNMVAEDFEGVPRLTTLSAKDNGITTLAGKPFKHLGNLKFLHLCQNKLRQLNKEALSSLTNLNVLTIDKNQIERIDDDTFAANNKLTKLSIKSNGLTSIGVQTFAALQNLEELWLLYNQLTVAPNIKHNKALKILGLCTNPIGDLPDGVFDGPDKLEVVLLRSLGLTELKPTVFGNMDGITELNLAMKNNFTAVPPVIRKMSSLRSLKLSGNPIRTLCVSELAGLNNLQEVRLDNMLLKSYDVTQLFPALPALRTLYLAGNPWRCDCDMQWYALGIDGARAKIETKDREQITCESPARQAGKRIDYLRLGDFRQCLPSKIKGVSSTTAVISLPYLGMLDSDGVDVFHAVSYIPLNGGVEKKLRVFHKREVKLTGLTPSTRYLVCTATITVSEEKGQDKGSTRKENELCQKFKTATATGKIGDFNDDMLDQAVKAGLTKHDLLILYAVLGAVLGFVALISFGATTVWCRRTRSEMRNQFANISSVSEEGRDDSMRRGNGRNGEFQHPSKSEDNQIRTNSSVMMMPARKEGHPNMAYEAAGDAPKGVRTKL